MKILSIETSCDDTGITIMEASGSTKNASFRVLADSTNSQIKIHIPYGGVFPMLAKREHIRNLPILLEEVLKKSKLEKVVRQDLTIKKKSLIDLIAVTYGPGLEPALWAGITFAQELAKKWNVPLIPVNHMEGHILSVFAKSKKFTIPKVEVPTLSLLVSGGHTQLVLSKKWLQYEIVGETLDDAVGEAFDKVARMLGLPYPGGPKISKLAEKERKARFSRGLSARIRLLADRYARPVGLRNASLAREPGFSLPRPMLHSKDFNFSFAGLKTAVLYLTRKIGTLDEKTKSAIALEFENAAIECLIYKTKKAIEKYKIKTVTVGGGVSCNEHLRREMKNLKNIKLLFPEKKFTGDNSLMIGIAGYLQYMKNKNLPAGRHGKVPRLDSIKATGNLKLGNQF